MIKDNQVITSTNSTYLHAQAIGMIILIRRNRSLNEIHDTVQITLNNFALELRQTNFSFLNVNRYRANTYFSQYIFGVHPRSFRKNYRY